MATNFWAKFGYLRLLGPAAFQNGLHSHSKYTMAVYCYVLCKCDEDRFSTE